MPASRRRAARLSIGLGLVVLALFLAWRFVRPLNIFVVSEAFERPVATDSIPAPLATLRAEECAACHRAFYDEWRTTIHSRAWTDPYFQVDWRFDGAQQICKNCHIPLDRQQEDRVIGFRDRDKWQPILAPNPAFDRTLQHEGVTCAACHFQAGKILGVSGGPAPHPVERLADPNEICLRCHVVGGERWDTFYRLPPCGTVAEIERAPDTIGGSTTRSAKVMRARLPFAASGEIAVRDVAAFGCVQCHMPLTERPIAEGGTPKPTRQHLWRGGHDPQMVKSALTASLTEMPSTASGKRVFALSLANTGAAHYLPTGTPDRHLTARLRLLDAAGAVIEEEAHVLRRTVLWRPFIVDLWDTRLPRDALRIFASRSRRTRTRGPLRWKPSSPIICSTRRGASGSATRTPSRSPTRSTGNASILSVAQAE
ncbi:MAG: hypothetical protein HC807_02095 [Gammaproteobacteria bacterium]|nr:hypothetical protein [Gammaproteobacteria bacterium]